MQMRAEAAAESPTMLRLPRTGGDEPEPWRVLLEGNGHPLVEGPRGTPIGRASGERALVLAVLVDAIRCLTGSARLGRNRAQIILETREWVVSEDRQWPFSFENVCDALDLDAATLRTRLLRMAPPMRAEDHEQLNRRPRPNRPREEDVIAAVRAGNPLRVVAATFGISVRQASTLSGNLASRMKRERDVEIRALRGQGWTYDALAERFRLSRFRVARVCARRDADLTP
jgi:hypothetical protein